MRRWAPFVLVVVLVVSVASSAFAAAPVATGDMAVQLWPGAEPGTTVVIVSVTLSERTPLPATVRLPVFSGGTVSWAGEVFDVAGSDIQHEPVLKQGTGGQYAEFEVTESRQAQVELSGVPLTATNGTYSTSLDFVQSTEASVTGFSVRLPSGAANVVIEPAPAGAPEQNEAGETLYTLPSKEMAVGSAHQVSASYTLGGGAASNAGGSDREDTVLIALLGMLGVLVVVVVVMLRRQRSGN
jgi:hypothetical protein